MLHPDCKAKIGEYDPRLLDMFEAMADEAALDGSPAKTLVLPLYDAQSGLQPGDLAAELHFVIRKVDHVIEEDEAGPSLPTEPRTDRGS